MVSARANLPSVIASPLELLPIFQNVADIVIGATVTDHSGITCRAGCGACCRQLVPLGEFEAIYLATLIESMEPDRQAIIKSRFQHIINTLRLVGMLERLNPGALAGEKAVVQAGADYFQLGLACPFLENESCGVYPHRPMVCREYLVTSPPENCLPPPGKLIKLVSMPVKVSRTLYSFSDSKGLEPGTVKTVPLPLLLEFAASHSITGQPTMLLPELFENFIARLGGQTSRTE